MDIPDAVTEQTFRAAIAASTLGLMKYVERGGRPDAIPAGTGTLVSIGHVLGLLTAAHVTRELPSSGPVGLVRFLLAREENPHVRMDETEKIEFGPHEPDLAFLRFTHGAAEALRASNTFVDLLRPRTQFLVGEKSHPYLLYVAGVVAERTLELPGTSRFPIGRGVKAALFNVTVDDDIRGENGVVHVRPNLSHSDVPASYEGVSGGGLWRCYIERGGGGARGVAIAGVAFKQSEDRRVISCVSVEPIYRDLIDRIQTRWPMSD